MNSDSKPEDKPIRPRWRRWAIDITLLLAVLVGMHLWQTRNLPEGPAPELQGTMLDGEVVHLKDFRGKPVLVHFWATWCPICRTEEGSINSLAQDFPVLTVATGSGEAAEIQKYLADNDLAFPVLVDESGMQGVNWGVRGVPSSFVVDGDGQIRHATVGYTTELGLRIRLWLAGF